MATGSDIITRALTRLGIRASETALEADEIQDGLSLLNDMGSEWERLYHLGFSPLSAITDEVRIPRHANGAFIDNLAIKMGPEYSRPISPALAASARDSLNNMLAANIDLSNVAYPSILPLGSGNRWCDSDDLDSDFFPEQSKRQF
jgi:hypothetical protein